MNQPPDGTILLDRQAPYIITQTITRLTTTFTTIVTLGNGPADGSSPLETDSGDDSRPHPDPDVPIYGEGSGLTQGQLGAILGSMGAFVAIMLLLIGCIYRARRQLEEQSSATSGGGSTSYGSSSMSYASTEPEHPPPQPADYVYGEEPIRPPSPAGPDP